MVEGAVGFIGLGAIGAPMARHLVDWPGGLVVHDVRPDAVAPFVEAGATAVDDIGEMARRCQLISVMVRDDSQVRAVLEQICDEPHQGLIVAVHSTISPRTAIEVGEAAAASGVTVLDVAVTGGGAGSRAGTLAAFVGGPRETFEEAEEVFARWSSLAVHVGPIGSGTRAKLARNIIQFTSYAAAGEARRLAAAAGIGLADLAAAVRHSDAATGGVSAAMFLPTVEPLSPADPWYEKVAHMRDLGVKDLDLALEVAHELGVDLPLCALARERLAFELGVPTASGGEHPAG